MDLRNTFLAGRMNLDSDNRIIGEGEYPFAENIHIANSEGNKVGDIEKILSNKKLTNLSLGTNPVTIGSLRDEFEEKIYWAVKSDSGCYIIEYIVSSDDETKVLEDTRVGALNVLGFNTSKLMQMALIIDSDNNNRLLAFTDDNTQPKLINVERAKTYGLNGFNEEMILLIKKPPLSPPDITLGNTTDEENNIEEKFLVFGYRYKYLDGEYSAISPFSEPAYKAKPFKYDYSTGTNESMVNTFNKVTISINTGSDLVTEIDVIFKESGSNNLYVIESFNKSAKSWADNITVTFDFSNNKIYRVLPEKELYRLYDNVPLLAKALAVINNRIVFGKYTENYNIVDCTGAKINIDLTAEIVSTAIVSGTATKSLKSNRDYEVLPVYLDGYGRITPPLSSENNTVYIKSSDCVMKNEIKVTIASKAPCFAKKFRIFIKQNRTDYESISPIIFYQDGGFRWIKLENSDKDKVKEGDMLIVKSDSTNILNTLVKVKVLEVTKQKKNFLQPDDVTDKIVEKSGLYFKIKPQGFRINTDDYENFDFSTYHNASRKYHNVLKNTTPVIHPAHFYGDTLDDMTTGGACTLGYNIDRRYHVQIDAITIAATGTVTLNTGTSGSVDGITVNGVEIMSSSVAFITDLPTTASAVASNINTNTSTPNYTAVAVGSIITITSITKGSSVNGFAVVSTVTTITKTDVNMSGGIDDTFKWSDNNGATYIAIGVAITGASQTLNNGATVTFGATTGHSLLDEWNFYIRGPLKSHDKRAYGWFRILGDIGDTMTSTGDTLEDEIIENGASIDLDYNEYNVGSFKFYIPNISTAKYDNIAEWYYKENIGSTIIAQEPTFDLSRIFFMRCVVYNSTRGNAQYSSYDTDGYMTMVVESQGEQTGKDWVKIRAKTTLFQSNGSIRLLFETDPKDENTDIFFEIGRTYDIDANNYHLGYDGVDVSQTGSQDAVLILPIFNCFAWGNAFESYKIKDLFNAKTMKMDTRPSTPIENYRQNKRIASFTYSNKYEQSTNYNALNEFNLSLGNFKDLDDKYGSIQRMVAWDTDLDVWQEDKVHKIYYDKTVIYNQDGSSNLTKSDKILDGVIPYAGEYGISKNPESLVVYGNYTYWVDAKRGVFLRKGRSGIEVISNFKIRDWVRDIFRNGDNIKIIGGYDPYIKQYVVSINGYTLSFSESLILGDQYIKGWTCFHSYLPDGLVRINNNYYSFKDGQLWQHYVTDNGYNNFYNVQYSSKITTVFSQEPQRDKIFKTIVLESSFPWKVTIKTNYTIGTIYENEFNQRESRWYAHTRRNEDVNDLKGVTQGIGSISDVNASIITYPEVSQYVSIGDSLIQMNGSTQEDIGVITDKSDTTITVGTILVTPVNGRFCFSKKNARSEGAAIRGYYMEVTLEDSSNTANTLFAVSTNVVKSYL